MSSRSTTALGILVAIYSELHPALLKPVVVTDPEFPSPDFSRGERGEAIHCLSVLRTLCTARWQHDCVERRQAPQLRQLSVSRDVLLSEACMTARSTNARSAPGPRKHRFFSPTLLALAQAHVDVDVLCLSTGNFAGLGRTRTQELRAACGVLKV